MASALDSFLTVFPPRPVQTVLRDAQLRQERYQQIELKRDGTASLISFDPKWLLGDRAESAE
jgi:hypothetical protein